jgi:hypothetical protein
MAVSMTQRDTSSISGDLTRKADTIMIREFIKRDPKEKILMINIRKRSTDKILRRGRGSTTRMAFTS